MDVLEALRDPQALGRHFSDPSWLPWHSFLAVMHGQYGSLEPELQSTARQCTNRSDLEAAGAFDEIWCICGRRAGKSRCAAAVGAWTACSVDWRSIVGVGEVPTICIIASDRAQSRIVFRYTKALITKTPLLANMIVSETAQRLELSNGAAIEVFVASSVSVRGYSIACVILDEIAFWPTDGAANPDTEVLAALRPALATLPSSKLIAISSPYAKRGELWKAYSNNYGREGAKKLVWVAPTRTMNTNVSADIIADALAEDYERGRSEWLGEFRSDCERLVARDVVEAATVAGRHELPRCSGIRYHAFCDPSGGSSDSFTLGLAHNEDNRAVLDCIREVKPPFSPEQVVEDFAGIIKSYGCNRVTSDKYGGVWVAEAFAKHAITCEQSAAAKSDLYGQLLPALNSSRIELLDVPRLAAQLIGLERKVSRSGRDSIDHGPGAGSHDDVINSAAGALVLALAKPRVKVDFASQTFITEQRGVPYLNTPRAASDWQNFPNGMNANDWSW